MQWNAFCGKWRRTNERRCLCRARKKPERAGAAAETPPPALESAGGAGKEAILNQWNSREQAYATLEAIVAYLGRIESHSPTPCLLRRAVGWGRMSLPELMAAWPVRLGMCVIATISLSIVN